MQRPSSLICPVVFGFCWSNAPQSWRCIVLFWSELLYFSPCAPRAVSPHAFRPDCQFLLVFVCSRGFVGGSNPPARLHSLVECSFVLCPLLVVLLAAAPGNVMVADVQGRRVGRSAVPRWLDWVGHNKRSTVLAGRRSCRGRGSVTKCLFFVFTYISHIFFW